MKLKFFFYSFLLFALSVTSCKNEPKPLPPPPYSFDFDSIATRGSITALVDNSTTSYFVYKGQPMGFEYELLKRFTQENDLELNIKVIYKLDSVLPMLNSGFGDIVCANITVTPERAKRVNFTTDLFETKEVLVQRYSSDSLIQTVEELAGKTVYVRLKSSFYEHLIEVNKTLNPKIKIIGVADSSDSKVMNKTLQLIAQVSGGEIDYTVADENVAKVQKRFHPNIHITTPIGTPRHIAWAVRRTDTMLLKKLNDWLNYQKQTNDFHTIITKYFKARTVLKQKLSSEYSSMKGGISPFDDLIKKYAKSINWDWRLLASLIYQESKFDTAAESWTGATGLMQLIPSTAEDYGLDSMSITNAQANLEAGSKYLKRLDKIWQKSISDSIQRTKFVLASYNVGVGHIIDAKKLAAKYGHNPLMWDENVELYILKKSDVEFYTDTICQHGYCRGQEPYDYVKEVYGRYLHYCNLIKK
ncbi:MAG: transporter substrate-binding domain-containing protein [Flavobacteriales bacterium]|nr:transporter substrate-binding domain-containing protein [Flavobacteriales bacterium]